MLATVFGALGLRRAAEQCGAGHGMAVAGIVLGVLGTLVSVVLLVVALRVPGLLT